MIVRVKYFDESVNGYGGASYTYRTNLIVPPFTKVLAPVKGGELKKALIVETDLPESAISQEWADRVKTIERLDNGEG